MGKRKSLYLFDGSGIFYRAYFAFIRNPLINSKGENTSATFGFVNSILRVIKSEEPDYLGIVFDTAKPTFRHKRYPDYKANRQAMPEDLVTQLPRIRQAADALNIRCFEMAGYEADDIIGTYAIIAADMGLDVFMVTGDKDFFQLVTDRIKVYNPKTGSDSPDVFGPSEVTSKFGVPPEMVIDKLALMGDSSDNVPGVPGIGPKTADKLLAQFGSLDATLEGYEQIASKGVRQKIADNIEQASLSRELVTIKIDVPIEFDLESMQRRSFDAEATTTLFKELEFNRLLKQIIPVKQGIPAKQGIPVKQAIPDDDSLPAPEEEPLRPEKGFYHTVTSLKDLKTLVKQFTKCKEIAVDTETTSLNSLNAQLVGVSLTDRAGAGYYIPVGHSGDGENNLPLDKCLELLKPLLENKSVQKIGQNIKYDLEVLHNYGIDINPISFDTMLASYVLDPSGRENSLDALALKHFDYVMQPITDLIGSGRNQTTFDTVTIEAATPYAAEDADLTYRLRGKLAPLIDQFDLNNLYYNIELPLIKVLASMEETGVHIDIDYLAELSTEMDDRSNDIREEIYKISGGEFNINSTRQLSHILFEKLGLPTRGKTAKKTGYSTDVRVLEELSKLHPCPRLVLDYRQLTKLKNTYIDALPKLVNETTGRVHTSFNQAIAATGRLSSTDPNLQNIPIRTDDGRRIRKAFIPRDNDYRLLVADYSQIELRILAHYAEDKVLIDAFKKGEDIHARTAAEVYAVSLNDVTDQMRRSAKTANFAIIYGVSAFGLAQQSELNLTEAREFIENYFARYPGIQKQMERSRQQARDKGYVTTMYNRRRYIPDINSRNANARQFAERIAINSPIQGTAADLIKLAMIKIDKNIAGMRSKMILQVHDELVFDAHKDEVAKLKKIVKDGMENVVKLKVPLVADIGVGNNWLDAK